MKPTSKKQPTLNLHFTKLKMVKKLSLSNIDKLKDFVDKSGRLPDDITKKSICKDFVQLLGSNVSAPQKNQVMFSVMQVYMAMTIQEKLSLRGTICKICIL